MRITQIQTSLTESIRQSLKKISEKIPPPKGFPELKIELEVPKGLKHGDLTTNIAMRLAKNFSVAPLRLAGLLKDELEKLPEKSGPAGAICEIEVLPPGFINFRLGKKYLYGVLDEIKKTRGEFAKSEKGGGGKVNIEFVSANPTGPLTVAHGRQAAVGDALGRIMECVGYRVTKEYFVNDVGTQIEILGKSIYARYMELAGEASAFPEDGYHGDYIRKIAEGLMKEYGESLAEENEKNLKTIAEFGVRTMLAVIKEDLDSFGVIFDEWFSQKSLPDDAVTEVLNALRKKGYIADRDGAVWFRSTEFGDQKDRVVIKSDGSFTYLAPDIAYHLNKFKRGFKRLIDIWGPDHHGYIPRLTASCRALGYERDRISVRIVQLAKLYRGGRALSMSTRKGEFITLREVMDEVGCDVTKFFFLMRKLDSHLDFDLEVAKKNSMDNPVYYIQYAHARIASIFQFAKAHERELEKVKYNADLLREAEETRILRMLSQFPAVVEASAQTLEPFRIVEYLNDLAKIFHNFYTRHRVVSDSDFALTKARLELAGGVKTILATGLDLLGISFPERM